MKFVKLLVTKGNNEAGSVVEYDDSSADWLVANGYGLEVNTEKPAEASDDAPATPKRGRPRKADKS